MDNQWIMVELGESRNLDTVKLYWERARAEKYNLLASNDGYTFEEVYSYPEGSGSETTGDADTIHLNNVHAKYLKIVMSERKPVNGNLYGYSLYELEAYGETEISKAEDLLVEAEELLKLTTNGAKAKKERIELFAAMDALGSYLSSGQEMDGFTYHVLVRTLESRMDGYKNKI